jgi:putative inorganic carbon (hco3(-)) transporter
VRDAGLGALARPRSAEANLTLWAGRIAGGVAAFAAGSALGQVDSALLLVPLAAMGALAVAGAIANPRWFLVAALFLLMAYVPDVLASRRLAHALIAIALAAVLLRRATGRERLRIPRELGAFAALLLAFGAAALFATDRAVAADETLDLVSYTAAVALLMTLLDTPAWLHRATWAVVSGIGLLAVLAIIQQVTKTQGLAYGGFASILFDGHAMRSAGPLNPNTFGQILATSAVLAFYLALMQTRRTARVIAAALAVVCAAGVIYTESRAALAALLIVAVLIGVLQGVRLRVLAAAACAAIVLGMAILPLTLQQRVGALADLVSSDPVSLQDTALRGRTSENLAAFSMWTDHPLLGVGPDNFEGHYLAYSETIGIDPRPEQRGAHNLYLESLAETGLLGALAFFAVLGLALTGAWRSRSHLEGRDVLLGEGLFVGLVAFLICALTLNSAYARYQWIFLGLGLAAGRLARKPAR